MSLLRDVCPMFVELDVSRFDPCTVPGRICMYFLFERFLGSVQEFACLKTCCPHVGLSLNSLVVCFALITGIPCFHL